MKEQIAYISLGSNLGDSQTLLASALGLIAALPGVKVQKASSVYRTEPQGDAEQPWFFNQVACLVVTIAPHELLTALQGIEDELGRTRGLRRFGPRTMDLDLLLYGNEQIRDKNLLLPHPRMRERAFVLLPLLEIAPDLQFPDGGAVSGCLEKLNYILTDDKIWQKL